MNEMEVKENEKEVQESKDVEQQKEVKNVVMPKFRYRRKVCKFCKGDLKPVTYKDVEVLKKFISERGKILPARMTGNCAKHQRKVAKAIKQARILALLPFVVE